MDNDPTPRQAIKWAEQRADLTPEQRKVALAIALWGLVLSEPDKFCKPSTGACLAILWERSQMIAGANGFHIPNLDSHFLVEVHKKYFAGRDFSTSK